MKQVRLDTPASLGLSWLQAVRHPTSMVLKFFAWLSVFALIAPVVPAFAAASITTTTTVAVAATSVAVGTADMLTATVTAASGTGPTGTVTFKKGTTTLGTGTLSGTGLTRTATFSATFTTVAANSITAVYAGDANNKTSTSTAQSVSSVKATPTNAVTSSLNPSTSGTSVTFTATINGYKPSGTVTFKDGTATLGTGTLPTGTANSKTATYTTSALSVATHSITAVYAGDTLNNTVTSSALSQVVNTAGPVATTTTVASSLNPSIYGAAVTFTATVTGNAPTGTVTFKDGATTLGTGTLSGTTTKTATYSTSALSVATHSITAVYGGNAGNATSTSSALSQVVNIKPTTTTLTSSQNPSTSGASVTFTATVAGSSPTGSVTFKDGATTLGTGTISAGVATFATSSLAVATHSITAVYGGDANNAASTSTALSQVVNVATSGVALASSVNPSNAGESVTFTATVTGNGPTGTVTFKDGATTLGTGTISAGVATYATSSLSASTHSITALYDGDANNASGTSSALNQTVAAPLGPITVQMGYDAMGRPTTTVDALGKTSYTYYDSLGRPVQTQLPAGAGQTGATITSYAYNLADGLTKVTDPRAIDTTFTPNGFGQVTSQGSPDAGASSATYDANGNLLSATDARGKVTKWAYDNLNRLVSVTYPTGSPTVFEFDGGTTPVAGAAGELTKISDESGSLTYTYDSAGRMTSKTQLTNGKTFVVGYTWGESGSALDKVTTITYPSGTRVNYAYNAQGLASGITVNPVNANGVGVSGAANTLISGIATDPINGITSWAWVSGKTQNLGYDQFGRLKSYKLGDASTSGANAGVLRTITRDGLGRILSYGHSNGGGSVATMNQSFVYDDLNRLTSATLGATSTQYNYDATNNRTAKVVNGVAFPNTISPTSNRLVQVQDVGGSYAVAHDAAGNVISDGVNTYTYSDRGRMNTVTTAGGVVTYLYNALELRVAKIGAQVPTGGAYFVYDEAGKLLGEYDANGAPIYEPVYLGTAPVGLLKTSGTGAGNNLSVSLYNVYSDHLGAPRVVTNASDAIVWRWDSAESYGGSPPDQNPSGLGTFTYNQRFPGQVFDQETGLFQNWNRDYDARQGRYIQSDPIGLAGGVNTFAYVGGNPLSYFDALGLKPMSPEEIAKLIKENNHSPLSNEMVMCLMWQESGFDPDVENGGARGLMQIRERQALAQVNKTQGPFAWKDLFNPATNTSVGTYYLDWVSKRPGDLDKNIQRRYGTGDKGPNPYPVEKMRQCEKCLQESCSKDGDVKKCLAKVHR